jgi:integrase/recombinase XerD
MRTVTLKVLLHRGAESIAIYFEKDKLLERLIRNMPGVRWTKTHACWYIPLTEAGYKKLISALKQDAVINNTELSDYLQKRQQVEAASKRSAAAGAGSKSMLSKPVALTHLWQLDPVNLQALELFMRELQLKAYSPATIRTYRNEFIQLLKLLKDKHVDDLGPEDMKRYMVYILEKEGLKENTAHSRLNALKFYFEQVLGREKFFFEIPRAKKALLLPKVISEEKIIEGLLAIDNLKHRTLLLLAYSAGLRVSEVISLKLTDIDSDRMQIAVNHAKGKKDRVVTLSRSILKLLREYFLEYDPKYWLFEGQDSGQHYSSRAAQQIFKDAYKKLGLPPQCSFHSLRHSYATHLLESGTDISYIQKLLGHNDIKTTLRYAQVSNKDIGQIESPLDRIMRKKGK